MVFEHLAAFFVDKFLGNYIEDFDSHQVKISLWSGDITLQNVHLKTNALDDFNIPVEIITGYLEKLHIHIPWKHLYTHPTKIQLDGFYLLVKPKTDVVYDPEKSEKKEYDSKMKQVQKVEDFRREREKYDKNHQVSHHKDTFFERLQFHILRNLEIEIRNIHIAYDDNTTKFYPFQFGITLKYIKLNTTNSQWEDIEEKEDSKLIYKFAEINNLSMYWNSNIQSRLDLPKEDIINELKSFNQIKYPKMNYLLQPLNAQAKLKIAKTAQEQDFEQAVLTTKIDFEEIYININRNQYSDLLDFLEFQDYLNVKSKHIKYHSSIDENQIQNKTKQRWLFAYTAIVNEYVKPRLASFKWETIKENISRYKEYHQLYFKQLNHNNNKKDKQRSQELEKQIDAFNLIYIRRTAQIEYKKKKIEEKQMSWWDKLSNWWNPNDDEDNPEFRLNDSLSIEEKNKLYEAIGYKDDQSTEHLPYPTEYVDIDLDLKLNLIEINVWSSTNHKKSNLKVITRASIPNTKIEFQRRPARDDIRLLVDIDSLEMVGINSELDKGDELNLSRPVLIQPFNKNELTTNKLLHMEFETNPISSKSDYRIHAKSHPLQINYHATTINQLIHCFLPDRHHDLEGIKEAAYSIYTDIKNQTQFLLNENLKKIKDLDINIDLQSIYVILPEHGIYNESSSLVLLDLGHLIFNAGELNVKPIEEDTFYDAKNNIDEQNDSTYVPLKIQLENLQLLYLKKQENWLDLRLQEDSPSHLIKPITFTLDVGKLVNIENTKLPIWKTNAEIVSIESSLSDTRLIGLFQLIQSIPFPQTDPNIQEKKEEKSIKKETESRPTTKEQYETIEKMTPVKKSLQDQQQDQQKQMDMNSGEQITQLQVNLAIRKINILVKRALLDASDFTEDFIRISLDSLIATTKIKTYDIEFNGYIQDFSIIHEQFQTNDNKKLYLLSRENNSKLFEMNCLLTPPSNPLFTSSPYNSIENQIRCQLNKILLNIQIEALSSIIHFKNNITNKLKQTKTDSTEVKQKSSSNANPSSFKINFRLEEICLLIGNNYSQILYIQLKEFNGYLSKTYTQILSHFILNDFRVIDLYKKSLYPFIISKENKANDLIVFDLSLFNYSKIPQNIPKDKNSFIKGQIQKLNIVFLYKHIDLILSVVNSFQTQQNKKPQQQDVSSNEPSFISSMLQKYEKHSLEIHLDFILNAPQIVIPISSYSREVIIIDLGKLSMHTDANDSSSSEQHRITFENLSANRFILNNNNNNNHINLLECSPLITLINRKLNSQNDETLIKIQWDNIDLKLGKYDYAFISNILQQNFKEKIYHKFPKIENNDQPDENEENEENSSSDVVPKKQSSTNESALNIRVDFQIKQISLTLYLDETDLKHQTSRDENSKFIYFTIQLIQAQFKQVSDSSYQGKLQIQHLFADDLRQKNQNNDAPRLMNKNFNVDQNAALLIVNLQFTPDNKSSSRKVNGEMESFCVLISPDVINSIKQFFTYEILFDEKKSNQLPPSNNLELNVPPPAKSITQYLDLDRKKSSATVISIDDQPPPKRSAPSDIETIVEISIKPSQFVLIENQDNNNNNNPNCLSLSFAFSMRLINNGDDTKITSQIKDFSFHGSNFEQLKQSQIRYSVFKPSDIDAMIFINSTEQKIDLHLGDVSINIDPSIIKTFASLSGSITKEEDLEKINPKEEKELMNSKTIFQPKPFKDSSFWFIEDIEEKEEIMEETDLLEMTTGSPSQQKNKLKQKENEKNAKKNKYLNQQLILNLKIVEIKLELGKGSSTRPVIAVCLSNVFADIQNWSSDILVSSSIEVELALFNDHLLAWEPLIEPIIDEYGIVQGPWALTCETIQDQEDENDEKCRFLLEDDKDSSSSKDKGEGKENPMNIDIKKVIYIRAYHLLNITLTKSTLDLAQRLQKMFNEAYQNKDSSSDDDQQQAMVSIINQTGYNINIHDITGIEFPELNNEKEEISKLKHNETLRLTIPAERLSATHLPAIAEQVAKRKQQFQVDLGEKTVTVDINQTWRRVYEIASSPNPSWPIQLLCDSQVYEERRRVVLSSIIKVSNRTQSTLILLDADAVETHKFKRVATIDVNRELYLPIHLLYLRSTPRLYFSIQQDDSNNEINDFISFDWANESTTDRTFKLNNGKQAHYVIFKEEIEALSENTDEPVRKSFNIYVKLALHLLNLLPIPIECSIDNIEQTSLKPSELYHTIQGNKKSILIFTIPEYNNASWISEPVDLGVKGHGIHNEHIVTFHDKITNEILRMVLRVDTYRGSYRASFYSPFWIINATDLKFQFKIDNEKTFIDVADNPFFVCPKNFNSESHKKKGHIRLFSVEEDDQASQWSEGFSVIVIKSTGMTSCKVANDRTYMVCIDIETCSFGMTKTIILAPATAIINNSSFDLEITESISETGTHADEDNWILTKSNQIKSYWPKYMKEAVLCVRYAGTNFISSCFSVKDKHRTLLRMNDSERPALHVEVTSTDFDGYKVIFGDYKIGDAPVLIVNSLLGQSISYCQQEDLRTQVLPPQYYCYYTWMDPLKPRELIVSSNGNQITVPLHPSCGFINKESEERIYYATFHDGPQTVVIFSTETSIIESVSDMPSMSESMKDYIQLGLRALGISVIDDINQEDLIYISLNPTKDMWTETRKFNVKPVTQKLNDAIEQHYKTYQKQNQDNSNDKQVQEKSDDKQKFEIDKNRYVSFDDDVAEISDNEGNSVHIKRDTLDGLWAGYAWSTSNMALHLRINNLQIDDQLPISMFPTILYPIISKAAATDIPGKPFIELSVFKSESIRSNTIQIKYFKLLVQEFFVSIDQGLIVGILHFIKTEKDPAAPRVDMEIDLKRISKPLEGIMKGETDNTSKEMKVYFDNLHLSPLKIHVSFSMHGANATEQLLAEYPIVDFLLQILNVAEVQDVILKLNFYERKNDRFTISRLTKEITDHYQNQLLKQIHVVVLGLDVLGNPFGVIRGVKEGVQSFFYEPYKGAMEGPIEFVEGIATGTKFLLGSVVGGAAGALSKVTGAASKGLATLTLDQDYQNARIQRKEIQAQTTSDIVASGKNVVKDVVLGVKGVVKKPIRGAKKGGAKGFIKGLGKGFLGLVGRPASGVADLTSSSFKLIKKVAAHEEIIHRVRYPRHIGRDGIVRPSVAHETLGSVLFDRLIDDKHGETEGYVAHINSSSKPTTLFFATTKRILFLIEKDLSTYDFDIEWSYNYKDIKGTPAVKFEPNFIEITLKETNAIGRTKKDSIHVKVVPYESIGEARYIVDSINDTTKALEV